MEELVHELYHPDFVNHTAPEGVPDDLDGEKAYIQMVHQGFSDVDATMERFVQDGDQVAWRWSMTARHTGDFMGIPATGKTIRITGNDMGVLRDDKLAELWLEYDALSLMKQLGVTEGAGA